MAKKRESTMGDSQRTLNTFNENGMQNTISPQGSFKQTRLRKGTSYLGRRRNTTKECNYLENPNNIKSIDIINKIMKAKEK